MRSANLQALEVWMAEQVLSGHSVFVAFRCRLCGIVRSVCAYGTYGVPTVRTHAFDAGRCRHTVSGDFIGGADAVLAYVRDFAR